ncbi:hypothetical protein Plhal703r1_c09g0046641 [Plasmopara halstedii]
MFAIMEIIPLLLNVNEFARPSSFTRLVNDTDGPSRPYKIEAACQAWSLDRQLVVSMENRDFVKLLLKTQNIQLWDRSVLTVCSDVKFRLQHNALGVRYQFKSRTGVNMSTTCIHGCLRVEDAKHLSRLNFVVLNIIRCCALRAPRLYQNKKLYNTEVTTLAGFVCDHARAYISLHFCKLAEVALRTTNVKLTALINAVSSVLRLNTTGLMAMEVDFAE